MYRNWLVQFRRLKRNTESVLFTDICTARCSSCIEFVENINKLINYTQNETFTVSGRSHWKLTELSSKRLRFIDTAKTPISHGLPCSGKQSTKKASKSIPNMLEYLSHIPSQDNVILYRKTCFLSYFEYVANYNFIDKYKRSKSSSIT